MIATAEGEGPPPTSLGEGLPPVKLAEGARAALGQEILAIPHQYVPRTAIGPAAPWQYKAVVFDPKAYNEAIFAVSVAVSSGTGVALSGKHVAALAIGRTIVAAAIANGGALPVVPHSVAELDKVRKTAATAKLPPEKVAIFCNPSGRKPARAHARALDVLRASIDKLESMGKDKPTEGKAYAETHSLPGGTLEIAGIADNRNPAAALLSPQVILAIGAAVALSVGVPIAAYKFFGKEEAIEMHNADVIGNYALECLRLGKDPKECSRPIDKIAASMPSQGATPWVTGLGVAVASIAIGALIGVGLKRAAKKGSSK